MKVAILGGGALGKVMNGLLLENGIKANVYDRVEGGIVNMGDASECVEDCDVVLICVPSFAVRECVRECAGSLKERCIVLNCSKGLEPDTLDFLTDVIKEEVVGVFVGELSGPAIASEIVKKIHTKVDVVIDSLDNFNVISSILNTSYFKCVRAHDMHAVELGGVIKNVYALICGIIDGVHEGTNTKAFVMTQGLKEMGELGSKMGHSRDVFYGLSGLGDLLTTCMSKESRNRRLGEYLAKGKSVEEAMDELGMVAEGYVATETIKKISRKYGVRLPLVDLLYSFLYEDSGIERFMEGIVSDLVIEVN